MTTTTGTAAPKVDGFDAWMADQGMSAEQIAASHADEMSGEATR